MLLMNRWACLALLTGCVTLAGGRAAAQADPDARSRAADAVVAVFFDRAAQAAAATERDDEDDARVDRWLERCAGLSGGRPAVQAALYRRLAARASSRRRGEGRALRYMRMLAEAQPRCAEAAPAAMLPYYEAAYEAADRAARAELAEPYIEVLLALAQVRERAWAIDEALGLQGKALSLARSNRLAYRTVLEGYGRRLNELSRAERRLTQQRGRMPDDPAAARAVAVRLATERGDLEGAIQAAALADDAALVAGLTLAGAPVWELVPEEVLLVAELFERLADDPAQELDRGRRGALVEARFYYHHFLTVYDKRDIARLGVADTAAVLNDRIAALLPEPICRPPGPWRSVLNNIEEPRVGDNGNLVRGKHLRVRNNTVYAHRSSFTIPAEPDASYDLRMGVTLTHANDRDGMAIYFPIGDRHGGRLLLGGRGDDAGRIQGLDPIARLEGFRFPEDRPVALVLGVHPDGNGRVRLTLSLDGVELFDWAGPVHALRVGGNQRPPRRQGNIFRVDAGTTYQFSPIELRRAGEE